jgi:hypothetical protein
MSIYAAAYGTGEFAAPLRSREELVANSRDKAVFTFATKISSFFS